MRHSSEETPLISRKEDKRRRHTLHDEKRYQKDLKSGQHTDESDKGDRRRIIGRVKASVSNIFSPVAPQYRKSNDQGEFYIDPYNDYPWTCTFGTSEDDGIWMNRRDKSGCIMSASVWLLFVYSYVTISLLAQSGRIFGFVSSIYGTICAMALASHVKTMFTDPGSIPQAAVPIEIATRTTHAMCVHCQTYKPPNSHHCRICNRCVSRMDHHCPWMNNCIGAGNLKHFILFLCYTWTAIFMALFTFAWDYFFCVSESCVFTPMIMHLVRTMTLIGVCALFFVSSMLINVLYGIMTGIGTIDRLQKRADGKLDTSDEEPIELIDIFGIGGYWTWLFPIDPLFEDYDRIFGYATPQRILRQQQRGSRSICSTATVPKIVDVRGYAQV